MFTKFETVFIKPVIWSGKTKYYVGNKPSDATRDPCCRLGGYIFTTENIDSARAYARAAGRSVVECPSYAGGL